MSRKSKRRIHYNRKSNIAFNINLLDSLIDDFKVPQAQLLLNDQLSERPNCPELLKIQLRIYMLSGMTEDALSLCDLLNEETIFLKKTVLALKLYRKDILTNLYRKYFKKKYDVDPLDQKTYDYLRLRMQSIFEPYLIDQKSLTLYVQKQIAYYKEDYALIEIKKRHSYNSNYEETSKFSEDYNINELFKMAKKLIEENRDKGIIHNYNEEFYIHLPNCGTLREDEVSDYFQVNTLIGTSNIISMYPCGYFKNVPVLEYPIKNKYTGMKFKRLTNMEKFQMKYGNL